MRRYLVVAHRTLGGPELLQRVRERAQEKPTQFHLLVPVTHPTDHNWTEGEVLAQARRRLDEGLENFRRNGFDVDGDIGDVNPVYAVSVLLRRGEHYDGIILSTLPPGLSRWLKLDVPSRMQREASVPVDVVVSRAAGRAVA